MNGVTNTRITSTSIVKSKRGKIYVQSGSVKNWKVESGSKTKQPKGQSVRKNIFVLKAGKAKCAHQFAENVHQNQTVKRGELWLPKYDAMKKLKTIKLLNPNLKTTTR